MLVVRSCYIILIGCRAESVRWLLDTLAVCSVYPQIQLELCKTVDLPDHFPDRLSSPAIRYRTMSLF